MNRVVIGATTLLVLVGLVALIARGITRLNPARLTNRVPTPTPVGILTSPNPTFASPSPMIIGAVSSPFPTPSVVPFTGGTTQLPATGL